MTCCLGCVSSIASPGPREDVLGEATRERVGWQGRRAATWEFSSGASEQKGFLLFTCLHVLKNATGPCAKTSPRICASLHLCFHLGSAPGSCRSARRARACCRHMQPGSGPPHSPLSTRPPLPWPGCCPNQWRGIYV